MTLAYNMYRAAEAAAAEAREKALKEGREEGREEGRNEGIAIGEKRGISLGAYQKAVETARNALSMNLTLEQVANLTELPIETIQDLANK